MPESFRPEPLRVTRASRVAPPSPRPYIWPSWITKLMAGEDRCWWKAWYKAHHRYEKRPDSPDRADFFKEHNAKHDAIVARRAHTLREDGWDVKLEDAGEFRLVGELADVAGKPDIVATRGTLPGRREGLVIDAKGGKRRDSDHWQVRVYILALGLSWLKDKVDALRGEVQYDEGQPVKVTYGDLERERIVATIRRVAGAAQPEAAPSPGECRYCDVSRCPVRYSAPEGDARGLF